MAKEFLHVVIPIGDRVSMDEIPEDIRSMADKSVQMWKEYVRELNEERIRKLKEDIAILENEIATKQAHGVIDNCFYKFL